MNKKAGYIKAIVFLIIMLIVGIPVISAADEREHRRGDVADELGFRPLEESNRCDQPMLRLKLPKGFKAEAIIDTTRPEQANFATQADMNVLDSSERYLFQTHEVFDAALAATVSSVTRFDLHTGKYDVVATGLVATDGLKATPWGTLLIGEEYPGGGVWEILNPYAADVKVRRDALGTFSHEGIVVLNSGVVYLADEERTGAIYKFVPNSYGDLSSGSLYALKVKAGDAGIGDWVLITDPNNARAEAMSKGATGYYRPEDMELGPDNLIYIAVTGSANDKNYGRIMRLDDNGSKPVIQVFANGYYNEGKYEFTMPDNLLFDKNSNLYITEDPSVSFVTSTNRADDVWVALPDKDGDGMSDGLYRFLSIESCGAEPSGILFDSTGKKLYLNILSGEPFERNATYVITGFHN